MLSTAGNTGSIPGWETKISHAGYGIVGKKQKQTNTQTKKTNNTTIVFYMIRSRLVPK